MDEKGRILMLKLDLVQPNKEQPRKTFDEEKINELAESIKNYGVLQPLLVQKNDSFYEIIAGERRWRAAKAAGLKEVPAVLKEYSKQEAMEISLIENVQRADLNPIEEALGYRQLIDEFGLTQEEIAVRVAKSRTAITNTMRLLKLDACSGCYHQWTCEGSSFFRGYTDAVKGCKRNIGQEIKRP